ncbi:MAG: hypothetical protein CL841_07825 [Crocinitomicaceae bacterium]|nr:hypothetical protein [Crocinitomicaceae bacterium]|tara:strand:- start:6 stop:446 length:441 start_codon:yes stop_codon:yes gene_type:complete
MRIFSIVILGFLVSSCSLYKPLEFKGIEDYSFSEVDGCNPICVELSFFNPNPYNIVLKSANVKGALGKEDIGFLEISDSYLLKKSGISKINLSFSTEIKSFIPVVSGFFSYITGNEVTLLIDGTLKVKALGVSKKININESLSVKY